MVSVYNRGGGEPPEPLRFAPDKFPVRATYYNGEHRLLRLHFPDERVQSPKSLNGQAETIMEAARRLTGVEPDRGEYAPGLTLLYRNVDARDAHALLKRLRAEEHEWRGAERTAQ